MVVFMLTFDELHLDKPLLGSFLPFRTSLCCILRRFHCAVDFTNCSNLDSADTKRLILRVSATESRDRQPDALRRARIPQPFSDSLNISSRALGCGPGGILPCGHAGRYSSCHSVPACPGPLGNIQAVALSPAGKGLAEVPFSDSDSDWPRDPGADSDPGRGPRTRDTTRDAGPAAAAAPDSEPGEARTPSPSL